MERRDFLKTAAMGTVLAAVSPLGLSGQAEAQQADSDGKNTETSKVRVIDFENHYLDQTLFEYMKKRVDPPFFDPVTKALAISGDMPRETAMALDPTNLLDIGQARLAVMDKAGVDVALLSSTVPLDVFNPPAEGEKIMAGMNDRLAEAIAKHSGRFRGMAAICPRNPKTAAAELKRCVTQLGFVGWQIHSHFYGEGEFADHKKYLPIWEMAAELDIPVYLHPTSPNTPAFQGHGYELFGSPFGFAIDASVLMVRLLLSGLFEILPTLKVIQAHMGETVPFLIERLDEQIATKCRETYKLPKPPSEYWRRNVWCSTSGSFSKDVFQMLRSQMPLDHILFASDYPYENMPASTSFIGGLDLNEREKSMICHANAEKAFHLK